MRLSSFVVLLALASPAAADDYDDILKAYKSYLKLQKAGKLELKTTINRMTVGCARA